MKYQETAAETERETEIFNKAREIYRFNILCLYYRVNPCKKDDCNDCKFALDYRKKILSNHSHKTTKELIFHFQQYCRQNYLIFVFTIYCSYRKRKVKIRK